MLIVVAETIAHVNEKYIVGLAEDKQDLHSLLFDFYNYLKNGNDHNTYERNWTLFDVTIYSLNENDYLKIKQVLEKYSQQITKWREHILNNENVENFYDNMILLPIVIDDMDSEKEFIDESD